MKYSSKNIFLIDAIGAIITTLLLSQLLMRFQEFFGIPKNMLWILAGIALCFAIYYLTCQFLVGAQLQLYLSIIIIANVSYCVLTIILLLLNFSSITLLGLLYFTGEIAIILLLVKAEYSLLNNRKNNN